MLCQVTEKLLSLGRENDLVVWAGLFALLIVGLRLIKLVLFAKTGFVLDGSNITLPDDSPFIDSVLFETV